MSNIFFTGASSFSGQAFAKELAVRGNRVFCSFTKKTANEYESLRRSRIDELIQMTAVIPVWGSRLADSEILHLIEKEDIRIFCHHAADVENYKSLSYDFERGLQNNTKGLQEIFHVLKKNDGMMVLTGTFSEANEGWGSEKTLAFNPYSLAKSFSWELARYYAWKADIRIRKFVMGTPFGPWEGRGFTSYLAKTWLAGEVPVVKTPEYVRDMIPIFHMARKYANFIENSNVSLAPELREQASGFVGTNADFTKWFSKNLGPQLGVSAEFILEKQEEFLEPLIRTLGPMGINCSFPNSFWKELASFYQRES